MWLEFVSSILSVFSQLLGARLLGVYLFGGLLGSAGENA